MAINTIRTKYETAIQNYTNNNNNEALRLLKTADTAGAIVSKILVDVNINKIEILIQFQTLASLIIPLKNENTIANLTIPLKSENTKQFETTMATTFAAIHIKHRAFHVYLLLKPILDLQEITTKITHTITKLQDDKTTTCATIKTELEDFKIQFELYKKYAIDSLPLHDSLAAINVTNADAIYNSIAKPALM